MKYFSLKNTTTAIMAVLLVAQANASDSNNINNNNNALPNVTKSQAQTDTEQCIVPLYVFSEEELANLKMTRPAHVKDDGWERMLEQHRINKSFEQAALRGNRKMVSYLLGEGQENLTPVAPPSAIRTLNTLMTVVESLQNNMRNPDVDIADRLAMANEFPEMLNFFNETLSTQIVQVPPKKAGRFNPDDNGLFTTLNLLAENGNSDMISFILNCMEQQSAQRDRVAGLALTTATQADNLPMVTALLNFTSSTGTKLNLPGMYVELIACRAFDTNNPEMLRSALNYILANQMQIRALSFYYQVNNAKNAGHQEIADIFVNAICNNLLINQSDANDMLRYACESNDLRLAQSLLNPAVKRPIPDDDAGIYYSFDAAARAGNAEVLRLVLPRAVKIEKCNFNSALHAAVGRGHTEVLKLLLSSNAEHGRYNRVKIRMAFEDAARINNIEQVELFLNLPEAQSPNTRTLIQAYVRAEDNGHEELAKLILPHIPEKDLQAYLKTMESLKKYNFPH